jgi:hypothetical protein
MKFQRLLIALPVFNLGLLQFLLAKIEVRFLGFGFVGIGARGRSFCLDRRVRKLNCKA